VPRGQIRPAARAMTLVINPSCAQVFDLAQRAEGFRFNCFPLAFRAVKRNNPSLDGYLLTSGPQLFRS